jgi:hypothetical protein
MTMSMGKRVALLVVAAFLALIGAWTTLILFSRAHADERIPLPPPQT